MKFNIFERNWQSIFTDFVRYEVILLITLVKIDFPERIFFP